MCKLKFTRQEGCSMFKEIINKTDDSVMVRKAEHLLTHLYDINSTNNDIQYISVIVCDDLIVFQADTKVYSMLERYPVLNLQKEMIISEKSKEMFKLRKCFYNIINSESLKNNLGNPIRNLNKVYLSWNNIHVDLIKY